MRTATVVVPIWGDPALTDQCLLELTRTSPEAGVIAIDNTGTYLTPLGATTATVMKMSDNIGCAAAKSLGASHATTDIIVFMDCDAYPHEGWLEPLLSVFDDESVGMAGPRILNRDGSLQTACIRAWHGNGSAGGENRSDEHLANTDEEGATGACMAVRRTALLQCPIDTAFASTYDDVDLSLQFREAGWKIAYVPQSTVAHGSISTGPERWTNVHSIINLMNAKWGSR